MLGKGGLRVDRGLECMSSQSYSDRLVRRSNGYNQDLQTQEGFTTRLLLSLL